MLKRGRTLAQIAKQMGSTKQTVGQLISIYKLPRKLKKIYRPEARGKWAEIAKQMEVDSIFLKTHPKV